MNTRHIYYFSRLNYIFLFLLLRTCFMSTTCAQEIVVKDIPSLEKLPVKAIHRIFQDSDGYIWYGTFNGLCRDDGYDVRVFRSDLFHYGLLKDNYITYINEDHEKHIWFGTFKGAYMLDKATYRITPVNMEELSDKNVFSINVTKDGTIWVSVAGALFRYKANGEMVKRYPMTYNRSPQFVYTVYEDKKDNLLISITQGGMYKLNKATDSFEPYFHNEEYRDIEKIIWDETHQCYWLGTWGKGITIIYGLLPKKTFSHFASQKIRCSNRWIPLHSLFLAIRCFMKSIKTGTENCGCRLLIWRVSLLIFVSIL